MDASLKRRKLFYNNLLLLGLDKVALEKKYRVSFDRDMFCVPNKKGFEVVTFFLFSKLDEVTEQNYRIVWPLCNKETERQFQKTCLNYFSEIAKVSSVRFPRIVNSLLSTFSGDRFYKLYLAFSSHVLETVTKRNMTINSRPIVSRQNYALSEELLKVSTIVCAARTKEIFVASSNHLEVWLKCSKDYYECFQKLNNEIASLISLYKERKENIIASCFEKDECSKSPSLEGAFEICISYNKKVKQQWQKLEQFISNESELWSYLHSELQDDEKKYFLDGTKSRLVVPEVIYKECEFQLKERDFQSSDVNGKLCIERFLKLFSRYLEFFTCILNKVDLSHLHEFSSVPSISGLEEKSNKLVKTFVCEIIPGIKNSIKELEDNLFTNDISEVLSKEFPSSSLMSSNPESTAHKMCLDESGTLLRSLCEESLLFSDSGFGDSYLTVPCGQLNEPLQSSSHINVQKSESTVDERNNMGLKEMKLPDSVNISSSMNNTYKGPPRDGLQSDKLSLGSESSFSLNSSTLMMSSLEDFDIGSSSHFKMRNSWLTEDSLNSMTLPYEPLPD